MVQNAHDAIQRRAHTDPDFSAGNNGRIDIIANLAEEPGYVIFRDNGMGMSKEDLDEYLSSIGTSGTKVAREQEHVPDVIGQFGIGFLSGFVVASRIEVRTRHFREDDPTKGWLWKNEGKKEYILEQCEVRSPGTEVRVFLQSATDRGLIQDGAIRDVIRTYADMLKVPIHLNRSEAPINMRIMPWERGYTSERERGMEYQIYLAKTVPDSVLEVSPSTSTKPHRKTSHSAPMVCCTSHARGSLPKIRPAPSACFRNACSFAKTHRKSSRDGPFSLMAS